jgi:hypothetical protein
VKFPGSTRHFETKSDACHCASIGLILLQELTFWRSASKEARAPVRRRAPHHRSARCHHLERVTDLQAPRRGRRQAKGNNLADKLTVEANALADLKIEKAAVEGERRLFL